MGRRSSDDSDYDSDLRKKSGFCRNENKEFHRSRRQKRHSRSISPTRENKRNSSRSRSRSRRNDRSKSNRVNKSNSESPRETTANTPGYMHMTPKEKAELTLQKALFTAKTTDEDFFKTKTLPVATGPAFSLSALDNDERFKLLESVESDGFQQSAFVSSRKKKIKDDFQESVSHEKAIFGNTFNVGPSSAQTASEVNPRSLFHKNIDEEFTIRWNRWLDILKKFRMREGF